MSFAARATAAADRLVRHFGEGATATFRSRHTLISPLEGSIVEEFELDGDHVQGAEAIALRAPSVQGTLLEGVELTIAGDVYQVTQSVEAEGDELAVVPIDPPLQQPASDGTAVTISQGYVDVTRPCAVVKFRDDQVDNELILREDRIVVISLMSGLINADVAGDLVVNGGRLPVKAILPLQPGDTPATLRIHVGQGR